MKQFTRRTLALVSAVAICGSAAQSTLAAPQVSAADVVPVMEYLDRGIVATNTGNGMMVSWRFLANDSDSSVFKLYRDNNLIYTSEAGKATCYLDKGGNAGSTYRVDTEVGGKVVSSDTCKYISGQSYFDINMDVPKAGSDYSYSPSDCSVGDADGDGTYELFVKWDPSNAKDNSQSGYTGNVYIDCYRLTGEKLWRIDLGKNIRAGAHYTQFLVADFDLDGKAEMTCKTADGTVDGTGKVIGDASKDYRNSGGYILSGPEYYTLFDGLTGAALDTVNYEYPRGEVSKSTWGDDYGNRVDRFLGAVMYCDGERPSAISVRGYYTRMTVVAYDVVDKKLVKRWGYDTGYNWSAPGYSDGNHNCMPADVDGDGRQELVLGATCIDDNGKVLWCNELGHGDAMHLSDFVPDRPGQELWVCHEHQPWGVSLIDAATGKKIFHWDHSKDTGRACAGNIWSGNKTAEFWGAQSGNVYDSTGNATGISRPGMNFMIYWDGDLEREILDGTAITDCTPDKKLNMIFNGDGCGTNNSTKSNPCLSADILGDWREELLLRTNDNKKIRVFCTPQTTDVRLTTLMHDAQYRMQVAGEQNCYNQPPHTSFFLGTGFNLPARPNVVIGDAVTGGKIGAKMNTEYSYTFTNAASGLYLEVAGAVAAEGTDVIQGDGTSGANLWKLVDGGSGYYYVISTLGDGKTYYLDLDYGKVENGTNIAIWTDTASDAQLFKFVDNGDGTYLITTKATKDESAIGITNGSKDDGASAIQWECNGNADQNWIATLVIDPIHGELAAPVQPMDITYAPFLGIDDALAVGDTIFGDRNYTFTAVDDALIGAEYLITSCDAKNATGNLASITAAKDMTLYIGFDTRLNNVPAWAADFTKTDMTCVSSNDVTFNMYAKEVAAGETVTLGALGQTGSIVGYMAMMMEKPAVATTTTTTPIPTVSLAGDVNCDGEVKVGDVILLNRFLAEDTAAVVTEQGTINAECDGAADLTGNDAVAILSLLAGLVDSLPLK